MPARGHSTAPVFDESEPFAFNRFFQDLETHFTRCGITTDADKKSWAVRYPPIRVSDLWTMQPTYKDATKTYDEFKTALRTLYPGADDQHKYSTDDLDKVVQERQRLGLSNALDLAAYYRDFYMISEYLIAQGSLSTLEQDRRFQQGFPPALWGPIEQRLFMKNPDHSRRKPWTFAQIYIAAQWVLDGPTPASTFQQVIVQSSNVPSGPSNAAPSSSSGVKNEDLLPVLQTLIKTLEAQQFRSRSPGPPGGRDGPHCFYCGRSGCRINDCEMFEDDAKKGLCRRNPDGKVVSFDGRFMSRREGETLRDAIYEYARRTGKVGLNANTSNGSGGATQGSTTSQLLYEAIETPPTATYALDIGETLERMRDQLSHITEVYAQEQRKKHVFDGVMIDKRPQRSTARPANLPTDKSRAPDSRGSSKERTVRFASPPVSSQQAAPIETPLTRSKSAERTGPPPRASTPPADSRPSVQASAPPAQSVPDKESPIHPFANVRDATYAPPTTRNFGAAPTKFKNRDGSYTNLAPVVQAQLAESVFKRSMSTPTVPLTIEELLSISPELRNRYREAVTPRRVTHDSNPTSTNMAAFEELPTHDPALVDCHNNELDPDATIIPDSYETYLRVLPRGAIPSELTVAAESHSLRTIDLTIDRKEKVACILDPGSQVICMSEALCYHLGLSFDPTIVLSMQSANGGVDRSLGLVRNVPCQVGPITLYLQIHVIKRASYDVLLGRPFDVITESLVKNFADENQTITLLCPNTSEQITVPTMPRGCPKFQEVFQKRQSGLLNT